MNKSVSIKYILYIVLFVAFLIARISYIFCAPSIYETDFSGLSIASSSFPFGIIKQSVLNTFFSPFYYIFIHFFVVIFKNAVFIKIINSIISFFSIFYAYLIGKNLINRAFGIFLGVLLSINQFFLYYTSQIAPYCINFLIIIILIYHFILFLKKPDKKNLKKLNILNFIYIIFEPLGFIFVGCELVVLYLISDKKNYVKKALLKLSFYSLVAFLIVLPILIIQYYISLKQLIPYSYKGIGLNLNSLYLLINEYISPYLSFNTYDFQTKSTLGMLYSYFINPDFKNFNTLKIAITLFYSSILPFLLLIIFTIKAIRKNYKLRILFYCVMLNLIIMCLFMLYGAIDVSPLYVYPLFFCCLIFLGYGLFLIKDVFIKGVIILCLLLIQVINPNIQSFDVTVNKNYPVVNVFNNFIKEYNISAKDFIIMPYLNKYAKIYYKDLNFMDFDYCELKTNSKNGIIKGIISKNAQTINKYNIYFLLRDYLEQTYPDSFITNIFIERCFKKAPDGARIVLFIDKLNSKPVFENSILRHTKNVEYSTSLRKIDFKNMSFMPNQTSILYDCLKSRTLYNFIYLLEESYYLNSIAEYKKIDNEYYKINSIKNLDKALLSDESDYIFAIFQKNVY